MTVNELIAKLEKLPGDLQVCIRTHQWDRFGRTYSDNLAQEVIIEQYFDEIVYIIDEI